MSRIAAPMVGGMISSTVLMLGMIPALHALVEQWQLERNPRNVPAPPRGCSANHGLRSLSAGRFTPPCQPRNHHEHEPEIRAALCFGDVSERGVGQLRLGSERAVAITAAAGRVGTHKMAKSYQGGGRGTASMPAHCNAIASSSESLAAEYEGMASGYRQMAKQAQP